jgi:hypothetical protein
MRLIAFTGFKQSGKTTASRHLQDKYGYQLHNFKTGLIKEIKEKFPDLLREIAISEGSWLGRGEIEIEFAINKLFETKPPLIRALMQNYGVEVRRGGDPDYWVNEWAKNSYSQDKIVVDDVRFLNETDKVRERGGIIIRIVRTDITSGGEHSSETEQLEIVPDYTIEVGQGEHEKLYEELDKIIDKL